MYKLFPLQEIDRNERAEEIRLRFIDNCLTALLIGNNFETFRYTIKILPHVFDKYRPTPSELYTVKTIKFLMKISNNGGSKFDPPSIFINWENFLLVMCSTNNLPVVKYIFNKISPSFKFFLEEKNYMMYMYVAVLGKQSRIYTYLYKNYLYMFNNKLLKNIYPMDLCYITRYALEEFINDNDLDTIKWMHDHKLKFCPNKLLNYAAYINQNNSHHNMCSYFYSMYLVGCPINPNPNCKYKCGVFGEAAGKWLYDNNLDREHYNEDGVYIDI
jgi:hypothetical protein